MAPSKICKALGKVKDRTSISLAKVGSNSVAEIDVLIVKATRHEEQPADERYIREIIGITGYSRSYVSSCVNTLSRRLNKTKTWSVALKTLMLIHRLLLDGDPAYEQELFYATRRGTRMLNMSDFRDKKKHGSWDYSAFVRTYALYLDEQLEFRMYLHKKLESPPRPSDGGEVEEEEEEEEEEEMERISSSSPSLSLQNTPVRNTPVRDMKAGFIFTRTQHLQQLLERFLACRPTGPAKENRVVLVALYPMVKESFTIYDHLIEIMGILIGLFPELPVPDCAKVHDIFFRISKQFVELDSFYNWCKQVGVARSSEYPEVERIESRGLNVIDEFIRERVAMPQESKVSSMVEEPQSEPATPKQVVEEKTNDEIKALPAPPSEKVEETKKEEKIEKPKEETKQEEEADLLNLKQDQVTGEQQGDILALALFDGDGGGGATTTNVTTDWVAFPENAENWDIALVETQSNLKNQKTVLGGGFDTLLLEGMYNYEQQSGSGALGGGGSASSIVVQQNQVLALPAPPTSAAGANNNSDPFAASLLVALPSYVQMSEMEKKQKLLVEEQMMWQQYAKR